MRRLLAAILFCLSLQPALAASEAPVPPMQPAAGPGGADYGYDRVAAWALGDGAQEVLIFAPEGAEGPLPVVVLLHGWGAVNPRSYGAWIEHLVRRGAIVVFPRYQEGLRTPLDSVTDNAAAGLKAAFADLGKRARGGEVVYVGHSLGGVIAANLAARQESEENPGYPVPQAVVAVEPGKTWGPVELATIPLDDLSAIDPTTLLVTLAGDRDELVGDRDALGILAAATAVPADRKLFVLVRSDDHGEPALVASHVAPAATDASYSFSPGRASLGLHRGGVVIDPGADRGNDGDERTDALDYYAFWKTLDLVMETASGDGDAAGLLADPRLSDMGRWSDGTPVRPLAVRQP